MGRKRIDDDKKRVGISITIPQRLKRRFDKLLGDDDTRSQHIERFITIWCDSVESAKNGSVYSFEPEIVGYEYRCSACNRIFKKENSNFYPVKTYCPNRFCRQSYEGENLTRLEPITNSYDEMIKQTLDEVIQ